MATSDVSIASGALILMGDTGITSFNENSRRAVVAKQFYEDTRDQVLRNHPWKFAKRRAALAALSTAPTFGWAYEFTLPTNPYCLRVLRLDDTSVPFIVEGHSILSDDSIINLIYIPVFTIIALRDLNFEFVLYIGVVIFVGALVVWKQRKVRFDLTILWGLTIWGLLHMAGGNIQVGDDVLYGLQLIPIVLRYDQLVHAFGFGTATLVCHHLLQTYLREGIDRWRTLSVLIVLMGCGLGAINEIIEFIAVKTIKDTHVGGYDNTLWDLIFNLIGGVFAVGWLTVRKQRRRRRGARQ